MKKNIKTYKNKKMLAGAALCTMCFYLAACGPSKEKIAQAQQKYTALVELNNQVVEAHKKVEDSYLDEELVDLRGRISELEAYNLSEMKNEEIDALIGTMDSLKDSYENYLEALIDINDKEEAAVLTTIPVTLTNQTELSFSGISLYEKGSGSTHANILEELDALNPGRILAGLVVKRDVDNTPWMLSLKDTEGAEYEIELPVEEYTEEGIGLEIVYDEEEGALAAR